jgi:hypothetical protein
VEMGSLKRANMSLDSPCPINCKNINTLYHTMLKGNNKKIFNKYCEEAGTDVEV